jgi:hypothetical protein
MPVTRSPSRPVSGSPAYSPDDLPAYRGGSGGSAPPPPIGCTITLTGAIASLFGGTALTISGQTVSYTNAGAGAYAASQPIGQAYPIDWTGERIVENRRVSGSSSDAQHGIAVVRSDFGALVEARWGGVEWETTAFGTFPGSPTDRVAIGIRGDGTACVYQNGVRVKSGALFNPGTDNIFISAFVQDVDGESAEWEIITEGSQMTQYVDASLLDWCGQDTVPVWTPDSVLQSGDQAFWAVLTDSGVQYEDASLTTEQTGTGLVGGIRNQSAIGTATLTQATTGDKFSRTSEGLLYRSGSVTTQRMLFGGLTININNGVTVAWAGRTGSGTSGVAVGGENGHLQMSRSSGNFSVRVGGTTSLNVATDIANGQNRNCMATGLQTANGAERWMDGESKGIFSPNNSTTTFSAICIGTGTATATLGTAGEFYWRRIFICNRDLRAHAAQINAWLEAQ